MSEAEREKSGVNLEIPCGFQEKGEVLRLRKSLYGLKQAPRKFFLHLKGKLEKIDFVQSDFDPCLLISDRVNCLVYVDDTCLSHRTKRSLLE
jgi:hypothetical protein